MKTRILVFPCGSEIGLEIQRALTWSNHVELIGASSTPSHGKYVYTNYIEEVPFVDKHNFINKINSIIDEYKIDFIFPAHDSVVLKLAQNQKELNCNVISSPLKTCQVCRSKKKTYQLFQSKLRVPKLYTESDQDLSFPVFLKPDVGQGSKGTYSATSNEEIKFYRKLDPSLLIMEYLPGLEYTIDCFTDRHGVLRFIGPRERARIYNGISVSARPVPIERFSGLANIINQTLQLHGAWFFQVKESVDGELVLMEIAPRIAGTMGLYRNLGVNFALLSVFNALNMDVDINYNDYNIEMDRALFSRFKSDLFYDNVYIDLDDTIIFKNNINPMIIAFLYQCVNKKIKIHLLSRHDGDINSTLEKYRIKELFDTVVHINRQVDKADYVSEPTSIFIDDSFAERQRVCKKIGIPTFDIGAIESLIDWRS